MNSGGSTRECLVFGIVNRRGMTIPIYDLSACEANNLELSNFKLHPRAGPSDRKSTQLPETGNQNTTAIWNCSSRVPSIRPGKIAGYYSRLTIPIYYLRACEANNFELRTSNSTHRAQASATGNLSGNQKPARNRKPATPSPTALLNTVV